MSGIPLLKMASHPNPELSENNKGFHIQFKGHCFPQMLGEGENEKARQSTSTIAGLTVRVPALAKQLSTAEGTSILDQVTVIATVFLYACISRFFFFDSNMLSHCPQSTASCRAAGPNRASTTGCSESSSLPLFL